MHAVGDEGDLGIDEARAPSGPCGSAVHSSRSSSIWCKPSAKPGYRAEIARISPAPAGRSPAPGHARYRDCRRARGRSATAASRAAAAPLALPSVRILKSLWSITRRKRSPSICRLTRRYPHAATAQPVGSSSSCRAPERESQDFPSLEPYVHERHCPQIACHRVSERNDSPAVGRRPVKRFHKQKMLYCSRQDLRHLTDPHMSEALASVLAHLDDRPMRHWSGFSPCFAFRAFRPTPPMTRHAARPPHGARASSREIGFEARVHQTSGKPMVLGALARTRRQTRRMCCSTAITTCSPPTRSTCGRRRPSSRALPTIRSTADHRGARLQRRQGPGDDLPRSLPRLDGHDRARCRPRSRCCWRARRNAAAPACPPSSTPMPMS